MRPENGEELRTRHNGEKLEWLTGGGRMDPPAPTLFALLITPVTIPHNSSHNTTIPHNSSHTTSTAANWNTQLIAGARETQNPITITIGTLKAEKSSTVHKISIGVKVCKMVVYQKYLGGESIE